MLNDNALSTWRSLEEFIPLKQGEWLLTDVVISETSMPGYVSSFLLSLPRHSITSNFNT